MNRKREQLFAAALDVHRAFIDGAASKILHNLGALQASASTAQKNEERRKLLGDLWSTLFLVVPVLSTTFASMDRMFGELPDQTLGWLLIDEAGQASPQAALGGISRSKRTLVVGDPLQVPPVVTLPSRLNSGICEFFKVDEDRWTAPAASAQTLSDQCSLHQSVLSDSADGQHVGLPLLVHRRCQNPMFSISNRIAYAGKMVQAVGPKREDIESVLGQSAWFDTTGEETDSKWSAAEGACVLELLARVVDASILNPDIFVISPFRVVSQEMTRLLESRPDLLRALSSDTEKWLKDRIGTIHTFQGREADAVILVLGASGHQHQGARDWAACTPNILNVAVSRAKSNLYVVGSRTAWGSVGVASIMSAEL